MKAELTPAKMAAFIGLAVVVIGGVMIFVLNGPAGQGHAPETEAVKPHEAAEYYKQYTETPGGPPGSGVPGGPGGAEAAARAQGAPGGQ